MLLETVLTGVCVQCMQKQVQKPSPFPPRTLAFGPYMSGISDPVHIYIFFVLWFFAEEWEIRICSMTNLTNCQTNKICE